jgi:site-specific DNA-methyltransferase (adenine-specific)
VTRLAPYYEDGCCTIYHGDCREILPTLDKVDLVLTDPPHGIADKWKGGFGHGWGNARSVAPERNAWDAAIPDGETMDAVVSAGKLAIVWGGNYFPLPPSRCWLIWNKPERGFSLAEAEMAWTNADNVVRVCDANRSDTGRIHPTQKPLKLMRWCMGLSWSKNAKTILDPFMGSGTTLRAAKDLGVKCIGIEREEKYCAIAVKRLAQETLFGVD